MNIDTIVFDLDGVLLDHEERDYQSFLLTARKFGWKDPSRSEIITQRKNRSVAGEILAGISGHATGTALKPAVEFRSNLLQSEETRAYDRLFAQAASTIRKLHATGFKLHVATLRQDKQHIARLFESEGILSLFESIYCLDDVHSSIPLHQSQGEYFIDNKCAILRRLMLENTITSAAYVGDMVYDMIAARRIGLLPIGIASGYTSKEELARHADMCVAGLEEIVDVLGKAHSNEQFSSKRNESAQSGAAIAVEELERIGVQSIFGIPGDVTAFFEALKGSPIRFIATRHEQCAALMADAYGRLSRLPGVCYGSLGPGATNLITGVANAYQDRSPVVALVDQLKTTEFHSDFHQYIDLEELFRPITKKVIALKKAEDIPQALRTAFEIAKEEKAGPVAVILPEDVLTQKVPVASLRRRIEHQRLVMSSKISGAQIERTYDVIRNSKFGVAIIGEEVVRQGADEEIKSFVEHFRLPFFTTFMAKGAISEDHPLSLGALSRHFETIYARVFEEADLILTIGYDFIEGIKPSIWEKGKPKTVVSIDTVSNPAPEFFNPSFEVVADLRAFLASFQSYPAQDRNIPVDLQAMRRERNIAFRQKSDKNSFLCDLLEVVRKEMNESDILVSDVGLHKQFVALAYRAIEPKTVIFSNGLSVMGFGLPAALGAKIASPDKRVVAVCGDGGFLLNIHELETSSRERVPVVIILFEDASYGLIRWKQNIIFGADKGVRLTNPDFVSLARSFGVKAVRSLDLKSFENAFSQAIKENITTVISVPISYDYRMK